MQSNNAIFGVVFFAFVIFITMRGKLPRYMGFLLG